MNRDDGIGPHLGLTSNYETTATFSKKSHKLVFYVMEGFSMIAIDNFYKILLSVKIKHKWLQLYQRTFANSRDC